MGIMRFGQRDPANEAIAFDQGKKLVEIGSLLARSMLMLARQNDEIGLTLKRRISSISHDERRQIFLRDGPRYGKDDRQIRPVEPLLHHYLRATRPSGDGKARHARRHNMKFLASRRTIGPDLTIGFVRRRHDYGAGLRDGGSFSLDPLVKAGAGYALHLLIDPQGMRREDIRYAKFLLYHRSHLSSIGKMRVDYVRAIFTT